MSETESHCQDVFSDGIKSDKWLTILGYFLSSSHSSTVGKSSSEPQDSRGKDVSLFSVAKDNCNNFCPL